MVHFSNEEVFGWITKNQVPMLRFVKRVNETEISSLAMDVPMGKIEWQNKRLMEFVRKCISLFPPNAIERAFCKRIDFLPTAWFTRGSTPQKPNVTAVRQDAETEFSLPCGFATFMSKDPVNVYRQRIELYEFPDYLPPLVESVYLAYTFIHEFSHVIQKSSFYYKHYEENFLKDVVSNEPSHFLVIGGEKIDPRKWQEDFLERALKYPPITTYSGIYKDVDDHVRIHEYMADYMTTYIMGFAMNKDARTPENGFDDKPEMFQLIKNFIEAKAVIVAK